MQDIVIRPAAPVHATKAVPQVTAEVIASSTGPTDWVYLSAGEANADEVGVGAVGVTVGSGLLIEPNGVIGPLYVDLAATMLYCISTSCSQTLGILYGARR